MKKTIYIFLAILAATVLMNSCSEDWLEVDLVGTQLFSDELIDTDEEAFAVLMAAYDMMQLKYFNGWSSYYMLASLPSDDSRPVGGGVSDRPEYWDIDLFRTSPSNPAVSTYWRRNYYGVYRANIVINELSFDGPNMPMYQAEAKFIRAYFYFELVRAFGEAGLYEKNLTPSEYSGLTNASTDEIYALIERDLNEAIPVLPQKSAQSSADRSRASKGAAQALLGKVLLYQEKFDEAASQFETLINSGEYGLIEEYDSIWKRSEEFGLESIFEIPYGQQVTGGDPWGNGRQAEGNLDVQLTGPRETAIPGQMLAGWGFDMIDSSLIDAWDAQGDDVRKFATGYGEQFFLDNGAALPPVNEAYTGWFQKKRTTWEGYTDPSVQSGFWSWETNERIIRYADVLLMYAEALNRKSSPDDGEALARLNEVRDRVGLDPYTGLSGNALFEAIKLERRLELAMEGHRFYDLVRWGDAPEVLGPLGFQEGVHEVYPIPETELGTTALRQNNGY